jgi:NitT/TauT family transport system ATP-binding protein
MTMPSPGSAIRFVGVGKRYSTPARPEVWALADFDLDAPAQAITCVVGPSGCGKTTLLRLAAGLETPSQGRVLVEGRPVSGPPDGIGMVSQEGGLLPWRTALGNVTLGLELRGVGRTERRHRAQAVLRRLHLPPDVERSCPHELSGGMRQRLALARALCSGPRILLMDEPFAAVDEPTRHHLQNELLAVWAADRQTILFVTHSIEEAVYLADRVVVMTFGRAVAVIPLGLARPRDRLADGFVNTLVTVRRTLTEHLGMSAPMSG